MDGGECPISFWENHAKWRGKKYMVGGLILKGKKKDEVIKIKGPFNHSYFLFFMPKS